MAEGEHHREHLPIYPWWDQVPEHLVTRKKLNELGLKAGGPVRARIQYTAHKQDRDYPLYDQREAVAKKPPTAAHRIALERAQEALRTCKECGQVQEKRSGLDRDGWCWPCVARWERISRKADQDDSIVWARRQLLKHAASTVILDTETTDLSGRICEIAVIDLAGNVLLDTLVNPQTPNLATHIHGITDDMVRDAPTFSMIEPELRRIVHGKRVLAYNVQFDKDTLSRDLYEMYAGPTPSVPEYGAGSDREAWHRWYIERSEPANTAQRAWLAAVRWQDVMLPYSQFCGDWSDHFENYRWQPLGGGHRALGDCQACLTVIQNMAATPLAIEALLSPAIEEEHDAAASAARASAEV